VGKTLAVGDIHTKLWIIESVEKLIDDYDAIVFVGDYADDWNANPAQTIQTWECLKQLESKYPNKVHLVTGNHDYIYVHKTSAIASGYNYITQILINSSENRKLKKWLMALPVIIMIDDVLYSHAGVTDTWNGEEKIADLWSDDSPLWVRPSSKNNYKSVPQVFGHTPSDTCQEVQPNIWCIDSFSIYRDGTPIGDYSILEVIDGEIMRKVILEKDE